MSANWVRKMILFSLWIKIIFLTPLADIFIKTNNIWIIFSENKTKYLKSFEATFTLAATACRQGLAMRSLVGVSHYWLPRQRIRFLAAKYKHFGGKRLNLI